ncbi:Nitroreductase [Gracilibacillus ureilyticus]|uniref:Nitroreductase n=1 Tax=Gracilibacillus ureilyticus TaxID=531814 RepID=A0A1H9PMS4_9BACI|nr:nitroreductase family protein [Gracilibacillus ureilyticus]SER49494.1 Nitroreductase [Gracilibacillus ureilyticus]
MNVLDAIKSRREITKYEERAIEDDVLERVIDATYYAPTGNNLPSKDIIIVTDSDKLVSLKDTTPFMPWIADAKAAIVITGRPDISKYWLQDTSIAAGYTWLEAVNQGLGAAFGAIYHAEDAEESQRRESHARKVLGIPEDRRVVAIIGMGYPAEIKPPKELLPREEMVHYNKF